MSGVLAFSGDPVESELMDAGGDCTAMASYGYESIAIDTIEVDAHPFTVCSFMFTRGRGF